MSVGAGMGVMDGRHIEIYILHYADSITYIKSPMPLGHPSCQTRPLPGQTIV